MKIGVLVKQVPDTESKIRVAGDGTGIEEGAIKWIVSPYDEIAIEEALKLKARAGAEEVVVFSLGKARTLDAARTALAMGADRAVIRVTNGTIRIITPCDDSVHRHSPAQRGSSRRGRTRSWCRRAAPRT